MAGPERFFPDPDDPSEQIDLGPYEVPYTPQASGEGLSANWKAMAKGRQYPPVDPPRLDVDARIADVKEQSQWDEALT